MECCYSSADWYAVEGSFEEAMGRESSETLAEVQDDVSLLMVVAFLNSVLLLNQLNQVVVIATSINTCDYVYDLAAAGALPNQRAESLLQKLVEFVVKDEQLGKEDSVDGIGSSLLS
ncbi:hypothetical protein C3L33_23326, partial [Rhododendron williamsianum]